VGHISLTRGISARENASQAEGFSFEPRQPYSLIVAMVIEGQHRILLVDDDASLLRVYACALETAGFRVEVAQDGAEGLNRLMSEPFDVVVSDVCMPQVTGLELLRAVRRLRPDVPAVLMTAQLDPEAYERARELGSVRYLLKPFKLAQLANAVRSAANLRESWQRTARRRALG
jgi:DNA-binding NtrC family response regulator